MASTDVKERLISSGLSLFFAHGYNGTGVKEIVDTTGVPKGSFYAYFQSKDALACAVVDRYWETAGNRLAPLTDKKMSPKARLRKHFRQLSDMVAGARFDYGCLLGNFSAEMSGQSEDVRKRVAAVLEEWTELIATCTRDAKLAGELRKGLDADEVAAFLLTGWEGAVLRAKADKSRRPLDLFDKVAFRVLFE